MERTFCSNQSIKHGLHRECVQDLRTLCNELFQVEIAGDVKLLKIRKQILESEYYDEPSL